MTQLPPDPPKDSRRATISHVAEAARVSRSTASRALTGRGYVAPAVRSRVREAADRLGYVPDATAQHLRRRISNSVGLVVSDLGDPFYAELAAGATRQAQRRGYSTVLLQDGLPQDGVATLQSLVKLRVAGVVLAPVSAAPARYLNRHHVPAVEVDRQFSADTSDAVLVDNFAGARELIRELLGLGHRRIALFIDEPDWTTGRTRYAGYESALAEAGLDVDPALVIVPGRDVAATRARARSLLTNGRRPSAVFAANNMVAEGVWQAAIDAGLTVPGDLSVVAFDDAPWMSMVSPGVTAVAQDVRAVGAAAVDVLLDRLDRPDAPVRTVVLPARVVRRGSTAQVR